MPIKQYMTHNHDGTDASSAVHQLKLVAARSTSEPSQEHSPNADQRIEIAKPRSRRSVESNQRTTSSMRIDAAYS